ncbi:uncharacterized protein [Antedon mediterranea]|uniref:uncharacterized protein isoform X2 n=1 Tax=Antedon mediterranea TaxID=105859 RepID=UPI003AF80400
MFTITMAAKLRMQTLVVVFLVLFLFQAEFGQCQDNDDHDISSKQEERGSRIRRDEDHDISSKQEERGSRIRRDEEHRSRIRRDEDHDISSKQEDGY